MTADREADERTIDRVLAGDREAFNDLVERHGRRIHGAILRMLGDRETAADLAQETFVKAFTKLDSFRRGAAFYTWLYAIAVNQVRSEFRRRGTAKGSPKLSLDALGGGADDDDGGRGFEPVSPQAGPVEEAARAEEGERVLAELQRIDPEFREAVVLRDLQSLAYEEIAAVTGVPVGTVRSRIHRGRNALRERMLAGRREE